MSGWFRLYDEVLDDPKVQSLHPDLFRAWVNILCIANRNGGKIPDDLAMLSFALRLEQSRVSTLLERLENAGLIDRLNGGANGWHYAPHAWSKRQYKSDTSTERVKRFRQRKAETPQNQKQKQKIPRADALGQNPPSKVPTAREIETAIFATGKALLAAADRDSREAGAIIGRWRKQFGDPAVLDAIGKAQVEGPSDPVAWITAALQYEEKRHGRNQSGGAEPRNPLVRAQLAAEREADDRGDEGGSHLRIAAANGG